MKKTVALILVFVICLPLIACGGNNEPEKEQHTCVGVEWVVKEEASCVEDGVKQHICSCGKVAATELIPVVPHTFVDGVCEVCGNEESK